MSDLEFNIDKENEYLKQSFRSSKGDKGFNLTEFLLKKGIVKDIRQANIFLVIFVIIMIALSVYIFSNISSGRKIKLTQEEAKYVNSLNKKTPQQYDATLFPINR